MANGFQKVASNYKRSATFLIYGKSGTGKTTSLLTLPRPLYIFDVDGGLVSLLPLLKDEDEVHYKRCTSYDSFNAGIRELAKSKVDVASIAIDSMTILQTFSMNDIFMSKDVVTFKDWGTSLQELRAITQMATKSSINFVCTALEVEGETGSISPSFSGGMKKEASAYFDFVFRSMINPKDKQYVWVTSSPLYVTKARGITIPAVIPQDYRNIIQLIKPIEEINSLDETQLPTNNEPNNTQGE